MKAEEHSGKHHKALSSKVGCVMEMASISISRDKITPGKRDRGNLERLWVQSLDLTVEGGLPKVVL